MISVEKARKLILKNAVPFGKIKIPLEQAGGLVLAENLYAIADFPPFTNSAMDGFALKSFDTKKANPRNPVSLRLVGLIKAGGFSRKILGNDEAIKIMTGAPLPKGADAVIAKEDSFEEKGKVLVRKKVSPKENVRFQGEEIKKNALTLKKSVILNPAALGFLASVGIKKVQVFKPPQVSILVTGDEILDLGNKLTAGKIYDSNSVALKAALKECGIQKITMVKCRDKFHTLKKEIKKALDGSDMVLISGGVSVGEFDLVKQALKQLIVKEIFWKVAQRPGMPMYFGKKDKTLIFGLPGNPASSLVVFYEYIRPAILKSLGRKNIFLPSQKALISGTMRKKKKMTYFWRGHLQANGNQLQATIFPQQGSHMLRSFAVGDCLIVGSENQTKVKRNSMAEIHLLPWRAK